MKLSSSHLETIRQQLNLSTEEFCDRLKLKINDYSLFIAVDDIQQISAHSMNILTSLMLEMEKENLIKYKEKFKIKSDGYFANYKILKHLDKLAVLENSPLKASPITVEFHPTNLCDHACPACTFSISERDKDKKKTSFDISLLDTLIGDLKELDVRGIDISGGGEPLLHENIDQIIKKFSAVFNVGLVTNGQNLNNSNQAFSENIRKTILENCTWCRISVDAGSQEVYERMHGKRPNIQFSKIVDNVKLIADEKLKTNSKITLGVSFLLTPENFLDLIKSICIFREIKGIDYFQIKPIVIPPAERITLSNMIFWDKRIFDAVSTAQAYEKRTFKIFTLSYKFADMLLNESIGLPFQKCWGHPFYPTISADGSLLVCCFFLNALLEDRNSGVYGKIDFSNTFKKIWDSKERFDIGDKINVTLCPSNCKLSETNKVLENFHEQQILHENFIN